MVEPLHVEHSSTLHLLGDGGSIILIVGGIVGWLPSIATLLAIWWYLIVLWESRTGRWWRGFWRTSFKRLFGG